MTYDEKLAYFRKWYTKNKERVIAYNKLNRKRATMLVNLKNAFFKEAVINVYTNGEQTCHWCGQGDLDVLCLDHIHGNGNKHRKEDRNTRGNRIYRWVINNSYPDIFQVLCHNCNIKKHVLIKHGESLPIPAGL